MKRRAILIILAALALGGCATESPMAFNTNSTVLHDKQKAIILLTATMKNVNKPDYQPAADILYVITPNADKKADRFNFIMNKDGIVHEHGKTVYLYRGTLKPGRYVIQAIRGLVKDFPLVATCILPLHSRITINRPGIYYLGRVDGVIRPRKGDTEFKAGPSIPLIAQAVAGFSDGTWNVHIYNDAAQDLPLYRERFPVLAHAHIQLHILRPFNRARAQKWWEEH